jgi:predicted phosphodiesterase
MKIGVFSDIHEDIGSLNQVLKALDSHGCDHLVCLGDIVGYDSADYGHLEKADAAGCVQLVMDHCDTVVVGNHDLFAIRKIPSFRAGFPYSDDWYALDLYERQQRGHGILWDYCKDEDEKLLPDAVKTYLADLPEYAVATFGGQQFLFSHHLYPDLTGSRRKMPEWLPDIWSHFRWMRTHCCQVAISGHTHIEGTLMSSWIHFHHTGNTTFPLGQHRRWITCPPVTKGPVPSGYMILEPEEKVLTIHYLESP